MRDITKCDPSNASRKAATQPSAVDPNIRRATRPTTRIDRVPTRATENRQPQPEPGAEQPLAGGDQPLAGRRVHDHVAVGRREDVLVAADERVVGLLQRVEHPHLDAEVQQRVRLLDVVGLVEDQCLGAVEVPEPQHPTDQGDQAGPEPPPQPVGRPGPEQPQAQLVGPGHRRHPRSAARALRAPSTACEDRTMSGGVLVLAATPIGDPRDAAPRLADELRLADVVAAEDTRRLRRLCQDLDVNPTGRVRLVPRAQRGRAHPRAGRAAARGRPRARRDGCRDAVRLRPRVPPGQCRGRHRRAGHRGAGAVGGADGARRLRAARRPVLLRGVPLPPGGGAGERTRRAWPPSHAPWCSSRRRTGWPAPCRRWRRPSAPTVGPPSAAS